MFVKEITVSNNERVPVGGWFPPMPDLNDYDDRHEKVAEVFSGSPLLSDLGKRISTATADDLPKIVDFRSKAPPIRNQAKGDCCSFMTVGVFEYHALKIYGKYTRLSERAHYKNMRSLLHFSGDSGGYIRAALGTAKVLGLQPARHWPYDPSRYDEEIPPWVQNTGDEYKGIKYLRHDAGTNTPPECVLASMKKYLASRIPAGFGFYGFQSFRDDYVPMPAPNESAQWGHAVAAFGYDDTMEIKSADRKSTSVGAFICRNSWGRNSGIDGYFYLPYDFVLRRYALDSWTVIDAAWLDSGLYGF